MRPLLVAVLASSLLTPLPASSAPAAAPTAPRRTLGMKLKAGWRGLGKLGQVGALGLVESGAALGLQHAGLSGGETAMVLGSATAMGLAGIGLMARRAKQVWSGSIAAIKLKTIDQARAARTIDAVPITIGDLKQSMATNEAAIRAGGKAAKKAARENAFLELAVVRAELALDESPDVKKRLSGRTLDVWQGQLGGLEAGARAQVTPMSEGKLALALKDVAREIEQEKAVVERHDQAIARFDDHVPVAFGGDMARESKTTKEQVQRLASVEVEGEIALHANLTRAMRGRVSDRLAGESGEFKQRRERHGALTQLREGLLGATLNEARSAEREYDAALNDRRQASYYEAEALQHTNDLEHYSEDEDYYEGNERRTRSVPKTRSVDNSQQYRTTAAMYSSSASTHTSNGNQALGALRQRLGQLAQDRTVLAEQLAVPGQGGHGGASGGPGWYGELFLPEGLNLFANMMAQSSLSDAQSFAAHKVGALESMYGEVDRREKGEHGWLEQQVDGDLTRQADAAR